MQHGLVDCVDVDMDARHRARHRVLPDPSDPTYIPIGSGATATAGSVWFPCIKRRGLSSGTRQTSGARFHDVPSGTPRMVQGHAPHTPHTPHPPHPLTHTVHTIHTAPSSHPPSNLPSRQHRRSERIGHRLLCSVLLVAAAIATGTSLVGCVINPIERTVATADWVFSTAQMLATIHWAEQDNGVLNGQLAVMIPSDQSPGDTSVHTLPLAGTRHGSAVTLSAAQGTLHATIAAGTLTIQSSSTLADVGGVWHAATPTQVGQLTHLFQHAIALQAALDALAALLDPKRAAPLPTDLDADTHALGQAQQELALLREDETSAQTAAQAGCADYGAFVDAVDHYQLDYTPNIFQLAFTDSTGIESLIAVSGLPHQEDVVRARWADVQTAAAPHIGGLATPWLPKAQQVSFPLSAATIQIATFRIIAGSDLHSMTMLAAQASGIGEHLVQLQQQLSC